MSFAPITAADTKKTLKSLKQLGPFSTTRHYPKNFTNPLTMEKPASKPGVIYLSRIPLYMGVTQVTDIFSDVGPLGRVYLRPESEGKPTQN